MGFLNLFSQSSPAVQRLPAGTMSVDRSGRILVTTVSSTCPPALLQEIAHHILRLFRKADAAHMSFSELTLHFASLKLVARELHGGAIVYLTPKD